MRIKNVTRQENQFIAWFIQNADSFLGESFLTLWHEYENWCLKDNHTNRGVEWVVTILNNIGITERDQLLTTASKPCPTCGKLGYKFFSF